jgi:hypothetical protein
MWKDGGFAKHFPGSDFPEAGECNDLRKGSIWELGGFWKTTDFLMLS